VLLSFADAIDADAGHLTELEVTETGKPWTTMLDGEIPFASDNVRVIRSGARCAAAYGAPGGSALVKVMRGVRGGSERRDPVASKAAASPSRAESS